MSSFFLDKPIAIIINKSLEEGIYPEAWKPQITYPNHKKEMGAA